MAKNKSYGYTYTKQGNRVEVSAPIQNGKAISKPTKTATGGLHDSVGFAAVRNNGQR